jgi:hypothetical protein
VYGSRRNVIDFFINNVSRENKLKLIRAFKGYWTDTIQAFSGRHYKKVLNPFPSTITEAGKKMGVKVEKHLMPYCFDWRECWIQYGECFPDIYCKLVNNDELINTVLKKVISDLYQMRNDFIHSAKVTALSEKESITLFTLLGSKRKPISIELTDSDLESIFENGLKNYFDKLIA